MKNLDIDCAGFGDLVYTVNVTGWHPFQTPTTTTAQILPTLLGWAIHHTVFGELNHV